MIREVGFNGNPIRIFDDGNIWVYATDIAKLLGGANNVTQLTRNLSDSESMATARSSSTNPVSTI